MDFDDDHALCALRRRLPKDLHGAAVCEQISTLGRAESNANPKSFVWAADPRRVLAAIKGGKQALESVH